MKALKSSPNDSTFSDSFWRIAVLAAAGTIGSASYAEAALFGLSDSDTASDVTSSIHHRRHKAHHQSERTREAPEKEKEKEAAKPQGPLVISISIDRQRMRIYDANGLFAETGISTGMRGHPTPMGVFSIIQKDKMHHSNIYSGAPMPYMQRITWSGIAIHAGVLPGYPASHGCIRMPMSFAMKMWNWTKMGGRVVVTPGELSPSSFAHPLLATTKIVPQPAAAIEAQMDAPATKSDKTAAADLHDNSAKPLTDQAAASVPLREQTHTADASNALPAMKDPVTMSDAAPGGDSSHRSAALTATDGNASSVKSASDASSAAAKAEPSPHEVATSEPEPAKTEHTEVASASDKAETKSPDSPASESKPSLNETMDKKPVEIAVPARANSQPMNTPVSSGDSAKAEETKVEAKTTEASEIKTSEAKAPEAKAPEAKTTEVTEAKASEVKTPEIKATETKAIDAKAEMPKAEAAKVEEKTAEKPAEPAKAVAAQAPATAADAKKDQARLQDVSKETKKALAIAAKQRGGQIAVFVSRKDSKLYVRQNFLPLFDVPVSIAPSDRPLGTHVFTAEADKNDANLLHWSVVTLPTARVADKHDDDDRGSRKKKAANASEAKPVPVPDSPQEALDRLSIPPDAMSRITEALSTGGSIVISDQGINVGETGEGTDFIISLR